MAPLAARQIAPKRRGVKCQMRKEFLRANVSAFLADWLAQQVGAVLMLAIHSFGQNARSMQQKNTIMESTETMTPAQET